ncbi:MAG: aminotransferase class I/II-fold pyridoxal phosphate-dependent enzyme [Flammeovirgaceae bacterium]|nr:aminotransferase class I/II-fold pyridoxal phosphate-dependent enzyme [Flammeovirgaceae bacterium]MDW8287218.1 aminotransferase class I/II-fold pyridoxal phosphate-dependent enzyme [Flammeovirgaceae bacterium]
MDIENFRRHAHELVDWMADYLKTIEKYPVKAQVAPHEILSALPPSPPEEGEPFETIFNDFQHLILKGITHWQHPSFFAYFPANSSFPSVLAEMLTATLGAQCMIWDTSPAATELEERMMDWLKKMLALPTSWQGCIQDTASTATLCALLSARERITNFHINENGFDANRYTVYCSTQAHSSVEKAVKIAGFGRKNLRKIPTKPDFSIDVTALTDAIREDLSLGFRPTAVVATLGTTSSTAIDNVAHLADICQAYQLWLHVDAAYAGTASILPELRPLLNQGLEYADSYVFNPHKWMMTNFDCSAYFVREKEWLIRTLEILPEYLKTANTTRVNNYRDWGIQLGRRFRALKLWFVIRTYGVEGIRRKIRKDLELARYFQELLRQLPVPVEILAPVHLNLVCFRLVPDTLKENSEQLNVFNQQLLENINKSGEAYLTHTKLDEKYTLRAVFGQTNVHERHVERLIDLIRRLVAAS